METLYTAEAHSTGGRDGRVRSSDGVFDLELRPPRELGGPGGPATNPEQLFAAGYSACFLSALRLVAGREKIRTGATSGNIDVALCVGAEPVAAYAAVEH